MSFEPAYPNTVELRVPNPLPMQKTFYRAVLLKAIVEQIESQIAELEPDQVVVAHYNTQLNGKLIPHKVIVKAKHFGQFMGDAK